ncbi:hypothetical protein BGX26_002241, partial [Mortierella sp. AD094]
MTVYLLTFPFTGVIGLLTTVLNALYFLALGYFFNLCVHINHGTDLRLRIISGTKSVFSIFPEWWAAADNPRASYDRRSKLETRRVTAAYLIVFILAGNSISFIINSGIKATPLGIVHQPTVSWKFTNPTQLSNLDPGHIIQNRLNSSDLLLSLLNNWGSQQTTPKSFAAADFKVISEANLVTIAGVNTNYDSALPFTHPTPGTVTLTRQFSTFDQNATASCDPTTPNCELSSTRTTLAPWADPSYLFDTPWNVVYNDHTGQSITIANISKAIGSGNAFRDGYIVERPTTFIAGYTEANGISTMVAVTTASFQTDIWIDGSDESRGIFNGSAQATIGSEDPLYNLIYNALTSSATAQPPLPNGTTTPGATAGNGVTVIYNTPTATSDNTTHITCVLYEANVFQPNQPNTIKYGVSCREFHIWAMSNTGATLGPDQSNFLAQQDFAMIRMYNSTSATQTSFVDVLVGGISIENITWVALQTRDLLTNLTERMYPFMANTTGTADPWEHSPGILIESWSLKFIVSLLGVAVVMFGLEKYFVKDISRADVLTLIENTTKDYVGSKKKWKKRNADWSLTKEESGSYQ